MDSFEKDLLATGIQELRFDRLARRAYSVDASIFEVEPRACLLPRSAEDIKKALAVAAKHGVSVSPRGAATGITGGCLTDGLSIDLSKHFTRILEVNASEKWARVEAGVVLDSLNDETARYGLMLGAETSTSNRATLGGMLANNAAGARSLRFGKMSDHILEVKMLLSSGVEVVLSKENNPFNLEAIRDTYKQEILTRFPKIPRRVSGYNLDALLETPINPCKIIAGSEGTLGIVTEMKVALVPKPKDVVVALVFFNDMLEGMRQIPELLALNPIAIEMIDHKILEMAKHSPIAKDKLGWVQGTPQAVFAIEIEAEKAAPFEKYTLLKDASSIQMIWDVRKAGLGLLLSKRSYSKAIAFIEDLSVAPDKLAPFMEKFLAYLKLIGKQAGIYGHVGSGCMHLRPYIDLRSPEELNTVEKIMLDTADLVAEAGGALSGEHGDGLLRTWLNEKMFGPKLMQAFEEIKTLFDPLGILNPGKVVHGKKPWESLRVGPKVAEVAIPTFFDFGQPGGLSFAANMCNGNGQCRKMEGTMCPSFQATGDEYQTTRARAQALRAIATGRLGLDAIKSDDLLDILDLCVECKGCKKECPSEVDMARMKAEVLYQRGKHTLRDRLFGHLGDLFAMGAPFASIFNWVNSTSLTKGFLSLIGISPKRNLPQLASERFSDWFAKQTQLQGKKVVLFNDTFTEFLCPEVGQAAVSVLNALGLEVIVPPWRCCGRTLISKGFLKQVVAKGKELLETLAPYSDLPIIVLEPSCLSSLVDEYGALPGLKKFENVYSLERFLLKYNITFPKRDETVLLHGHCHQKALFGMKETLELLQKVPGLRVKEIPSGCCGMAGSFGYEKEHDTISKKMASLKLIPAISANPQAAVIASGLSCRSQIHDLSGRQALHLAEYLNLVLSSEQFSCSPP